ncbi:unnamed protein product [Fraxinus pennsylvanica]|uniref:Uncharacterized protein n=1 Tax=Fraxinus pennsylvanica TaxID=56036 RepID=A0AAD1ZVU4_9LAMI|nr:unnamed protein product [Fraxinus pennsylvanica]
MLLLLGVPCFLSWIYFNWMFSYWGFRVLKFFQSEREFLGESGHERSAKLLELVNASKDCRFGAQCFFLFLIESFTLGKGFFHLDNAILLFVEGSKDFVDCIGPLDISED